MPGVAQQHRVGVNAVAHQAGGGGVGVKGANALGPHGLGDLGLAGAAWVLPVRMVNKGRGGRAVRVQCHMGFAGLHAQHGFLVRGHDRVTANHQVGAGHADARGANLAGPLADQHVAPGAAAFLRQAGCVLCDDALAFNVRRHAQQLANGDDARAAHARHDQAPDLAALAAVSAVQHRQHRKNRQGQRAQCGVVKGVQARVGLGFLLELPAFHGDKARAKAFGAREILVAAALVDLPFAAELGLQRFDRQAVGLLAAVAAAFADQRVDHHAPGRVHQRAALAAAALFGGAGLVVNDDGAALDLAQLPLDRVQLVAVMHGHALGQRHALVFVRIVGDHHGFDGAFCPHRLRDLRHRMALGPLADLLAARHGDRVVVQDLVGDVHPGGDALADRQQAAVKVGAVAQVGKDMRVGGEGLLTHPGHALAAHLGKAHGAAVHPQHHVVAANAGHGARTLGHAGRSVVRATRAKPGRAIGVELDHLHGAFLGLDQRQPRIDAGQRVGVQPQLLHPRGNGFGDQRG